MSERIYNPSRLQAYAELRAGKLGDSFLDTDISLRLHEWVDEFGSIAVSGYDSIMSRIQEMETALSNLATNPLGERLLATQQIEKEKIEFFRTLTFLSFR